MTSNAAIWRATAVGSGSEGGAGTDKIEFDEGTVPDSSCHITQSEFNIVSAIGINEKPKGNINEIQDTFVDSINVILTGSVENPRNVASATAFKTVKTWMIEPKTIVADFPKGRFGLRLNDFPHFNLNVISTRAYVLYDWRWIREGEWSGKVSFVAQLKFNGEVGETPPYSWT